MTKRIHDVRVMLAALSKPSILQENKLALQVRDALGKTSVRQAVRTVIDMTFDKSQPEQAALRDVILTCDFENKKRSQAASQISVSARTLYRRRSAAIGQIADTVDELLDAPVPDTTFRYAMARMISPLEPETAVRLFEREAATVGGRAAYDAVCACVRNGREIGDSVLGQCTGHWRLLAEIEIARSNLVTGSPQRYEEVRPRIKSALAELKGQALEHVAFELAYVDRLDAVRRCDLDSAENATRRLTKWAGGDIRFGTLALVCEAEQACDEGDVARAASVVRDLQSRCVRLGDFRITARASHVAGILSFLRGEYAATQEQCQATVAALSHIEPEFAACSSAVAGRAALLSGRGWSRPTELCDRFPHSYVTAIVDAVWARHMALRDPGAALPIAERVVSIARDQNARGVLAFAKGTLAIVCQLVGRAEDAQGLKISAWEEAVRLRRRLYLHDLFLHPASKPEQFGALNVDQRFVAALSLRLSQLIPTTAAAPGVEWGAPSIMYCLNEAHECIVDIDTAARRRYTSKLAMRAFRRRSRIDQKWACLGLQRLGADMAFCLPMHQREPFTHGFRAAALELYGGPIDDLQPVDSEPTSSVN